MHVYSHTQYPIYIYDSIYTDNVYAFGIYSTGECQWNTLNGQLDCSKLNTSNESFEI